MQKKLLKINFRARNFGGRKKPQPQNQTLPTSQNHDQTLRAAPKLLVPADEAELVNVPCNSSQEGKHRGCTEAQVHAQKGKVLSQLLLQFFSHLPSPGLYRSHLDFKHFFPEANPAGYQDSLR